MSRGTIVLQIHKELVAGHLQLPSLPEVSLNIKKAAGDPLTDAYKLTSIAQVDPAFCGYLVNVANSPIYRRAATISNVQQAISLLGIHTTKNMAMTFAVRNLFKFRNKKLIPYLKTIWDRSAYNASIAYVLCQQAKLPFDRDEAILAGLLQDIGCLPLLEKASLYLELLQDKEETMKLVNRYAASIGAAVLRNWGLSEPLQNVAKTREDWLRVHSGEADLADLIMICRWHTYIGNPLIKTYPSISEMPAFLKLGLDNSLDADNALTVISHAKKLILEAKSTLSA